MNTPENKITFPLGVPFRFDSIPLLWQVKDIYDSNECARFIHMIDRENPGLATNNPIYRDQDRVMKDDPNRSNELFHRLKHHLPGRIDNFRLVRLNERLRFYRYASGQKFIPHMDHWYQPCDSQITLLTVLIYFNSDFTGGETRFMEQIEQTVASRSFPYTKLSGGTGFFGGITPHILCSALRAGLRPFKIAPGDFVESGESSCRLSSAKLKRPRLGPF